MAIETQEECIQLMGDAIANIFEQLIKGNWVDDNGHDVSNNTAMINAANTMEQVMAFRTTHMNYTEVPSQEPYRG